MAQASGTRGYASPDGGATTPKPRRKSPSDLRREARRRVQRQAEARADRQESWPHGQDLEYAAAVERRQRKLAADKRYLRREVYRRAPELEGDVSYAATSRAGKGR